MRIGEEHKKSGYFWLAGRPESKIPGTLSIKENGKINLEVVGNFDEDPSQFDENDDMLRIIGHVEKDGLVTIDDCFYTRKNFPFGGISKSELVSNMVLSGGAWDKDEALLFNTFSFSTDCLDEWIGITGIEVENDRENKTTTIRYTPPEQIEFNLHNGMKLQIGFSYTTPGYPAITEAKITQRANFRLTSEELKDIEDFKAIAYKITNLLSFAIDDVVSLKNVSARSNYLLEDYGNGSKHPARIAIYYGSAFFKEDTPKKTWHNMLFHFGRIRDDAENIFNNWLNAYDDLSPTLGLYFSTRSGAQKFLEGKFLALAQGLETYHRRTCTKTLMDEKAFSALVEKVLENCPAEHTEWLEGRLMHGNEINLRNRLKSIIEPFKEHLGTSKTRSKLLTKIVDTRNYLTHYSENLKDNSAKGRELWVLCTKMEIILSLHFLKVIGFDNRKVSEVVSENYSLKQKLKLD
ncbi:MULTISPECIES: ApeA N-terminal domain 1-containing protein [Pseudomonas]|uniref:ApeA N-terminal domain 1-containing protein n=1 Tax=Pseudomonas TaxID=286 RepID=UPI000C87E5FC|nr:MULTISPECIES: HEPN domain-containing protein [Pseudomonas]PMY37692.1 hypothetical protein C1Y36_28310 [Pseudomonas sp. FW306-2-2C-D06C]PYC33282.1 hypothetical protein DMW99_22860 [Pseudomonas chlororaphis]